MYIYIYILVTIDIYSSHEHYLKTKMLTFFLAHFVDRRGSLGHQSSNWQGRLQHKKSHAQSI